MTRAILGVSAAAAIALAPLFISPAQAHADDPYCASIADPSARQACFARDPCIGITDPADHQACIDNFRDLYERRACDASPNHGQLGQLCG